MINVVNFLTQIKQLITYEIELLHLKTQNKKIKNKIENRNKEKNKIKTSEKRNMIKG